jgi:hypothetical protein
MNSSATPVGSPIHTTARKAIGQLARAAEARQCFQTLGMDPHNHIPDSADFRESQDGGSDREGESEHAR